MPRWQNGYATGCSNLFYKEKFKKLDLQIPVDRGSNPFLGFDLFPLHGDFPHSAKPNGFFPSERHRLDMVKGSIQKFCPLPCSANLILYIYYKGSNSFFKK